MEGEVGRRAAVVLRRVSASTTLRPKVERSIFSCEIRPAMKRDQARDETANHHATPSGYTATHLPLDYHADLKQTTVNVRAKREQPHTIIVIAAHQQISTPSISLAHKHKAAALRPNPRATFPRERVAKGLWRGDEHL